MGDDGMTERPTVTYDPLDDNHPFVHTSGEHHDVLQWLTRSQARQLRLEIERAVEEDLDRRSCEGARHHPGHVIEVLPAGGSVLRCRHCPHEFVLEANGTTVPVDALTAGQPS
jgi:hypothetical protein